MPPLTFSGDNGMINTFYGSNSLGSSFALFASLVIGCFFGLALERAGFGSSRRLAGIFYLRDMAVLKVMFTALITAMLGLVFLEKTGLLDPSSQIYFMPTYYGAQVVAGLIFGIGFVMGGWCPGTAAVGISSGRIDALVFFAGGIAGSVLYNELFPLFKPIMTWGTSKEAAYGQPGLAFIYNTLDMPKGSFALLFTLIAAGSFLLAEFVEKRTARKESNEITPVPRYLKVVAPGLVAAAAMIYIIPGATVGSAQQNLPSSQNADQEQKESAPEFLSSIEAAEDHIEPEVLADLLYHADPGVAVVDVRPEEEFAGFHIRGAVNVQLPDLPEFMKQNKDRRMVVLYSNGMIHPAQARDSLFRMGYKNVYILTDGLIGFRNYCLKPASLRPEPVSAEEASKISAWRSYFSQTTEQEDSGALELEEPAQGLPGFVSTDWLSRNIGRRGLAVIDCRPQPQYNQGHIPGALAISCESFRGVVRGVPSVLLPSQVIVDELSLLNITAEDVVVIVYGKDRLRDATLIGLALERVGHERYGLLEGGMDKWIAENLPVSTQLPPEETSDYHPRQRIDSFTLDYRQVAYYLKTKNAIIVDTRPEDYFLGNKSDEARAGHIPGAVNRPFSEDIHTADGYSVFRPLDELKQIYAGLMPSKRQVIIVYCRTGHQASQTYFVLRRLLKYASVYWYDAGWTEWSARKELPVILSAGR
jgi:3-mercaptopyruvate sulfurtransferase SseA/uncharacterized membrane protein YedE/YeeE